MTGKVYCKLDSAKFTLCIGSLLCVGLHGNHDDQITHPLFDVFF